MAQYHGSDLDALRSKLEEMSISIKQALARVDARNTIPPSHVASNASPEGAHTTMTAVVSAAKAFLAKLAALWRRW